MPNKVEWKDFNFYGFGGQMAGRARLPADPHPPKIIQWSTRHFIHAPFTGDYVEATCYLVPIEHMYAQPAPPPAPAHGKAKP